MVRLTHITNSRTRAMSLERYGGVDALKFSDHPLLVLARYG